jgi:hypothetical protein
MTTANTSRSPSLEEVIRMGVDDGVRDLWTSLPGKITKWDPEQQRANVKPLVKDLIVTEDGEEVLLPIADIVDVRVMFPRSGGTYMTTPVKVGDKCLLMFTARSIDKYLAGTGGDTDPADFRTHDLTDAVALMVDFSPFQAAISDYEPERIVVGFEGGNQFHIGSGVIEMGKKGAAEKVPIDSKVQTELSAIGQQIASIATDLGLLLAHTHSVAAVGSPTGPPTPAPSGGQSYSPGATASELVTIEK